jgi:hypothetical protein
MFNFFKKKPSNKNAFNILDESTWALASGKVFEWKGDKIKSHSDKDRYASEKEISDIIGALIRVGRSYHELSRKQKKIGEINIIVHMLNNLLCGMDWGEAMQETNQWVNVYNPNGTKLKFDISDISTWKFASEQYIIWNNKLVYNKDKIPITEKEAVNLFNSIYGFLERNGERLSPDYKVEKAKRLLNKSTNPIESNNKKQAIEPRNEAFEPRNPETWPLASNQPMIIDGTLIFNIGETEKEVKEYETEKEFIQSLSFFLESQKKDMVWEEALKLVKPDFTFGGREPNEETTGYMEKAREVYQTILKKTIRLTKKQRSEFINDYIQRELYRCASHETEWTYGGYNFSEAQMELAGHLTDEEKIKIGEIITKGLSEKKRSYQIKQDLFGFGVHTDGDIFVRLHHAKGYKEQEEELIDSYYSGFDRFESEDEIYKFFNESKYLNKHQKLKESIVENALHWFKEMED